MALPCFFGPALLFPGQGEPATPFWNRYFVHANVWIAILSFVGNYFWTHYFYNLLGAEYTMPSHRLNDVSVPSLLNWVFNSVGPDCDVFVHPCVFLHLPFLDDGLASALLDELHVSESFQTCSMCRIFHLDCAHGVCHRLYGNMDHCIGTFESL